MSQISFSYAEHAADTTRNFSGRDGTGGASGNSQWHIRVKAHTGMDAASHIAGQPGKMKKMPEARAPKQEYQEGPHQGEGGAPVPVDRAAVRPCECAVPETGQEHGTCDRAVRALSPVDGQDETVRDAAGAVSAQNA